MMNDSFITDEMDIVSIADTFSEELKDRAEEFEQQGYVSQDLADRLAQLGLYRLCNPVKFGGLGRSPLDYALLVETLAQSDASTGWVVFIGITSALSVTNLPEKVAIEMMSDHQAITAGVFAPMGRAVACNENGIPGYRLTGQWQWGSGSRNATYISAGGFLENEAGDLVKLDNGRPDQRSFFMPVGDVELLDTWHVSGLKGTGSTDFKVEGVFVPEFMTFDAFRKTPPTGPIHSFPIFAFLGIGIAAVALGIARACLSEFVTLAKQKTPQGSSKPLAMKPATHKRVAEAEAKLRSARLFFHDAISTAWQMAQEIDSPTVDARRDIRLATTHAVQSAADVVDNIYTLAGGTSVYLRSPIQRHFRDVHVATQHMMVSESTLELVGRLLVGLETNVDQL
ncbi:MAG: acyl-CoA dehydrogenase family protein [Oceanicoccus sp.]